MGRGVLARSEGFSLLLIGLMRGSIQAHLQVSKKGGFYARALRCMMVHDIFRGCSMDTSREPNSGLERCAWGSTASVNGNWEATVRWRNKRSPIAIHRTIEHPRKRISDRAGTTVPPLESVALIAGKIIRCPFSNQANSHRSCCSACSYRTRVRTRESSSDQPWEKTPPSSTWATTI